MFSYFSTHRLALSFFISLAIVTIVFGLLAVLAMIVPFSILWLSFAFMMISLIASMTYIINEFID